MRIGPHSHPCAHCKALVECCGDLQQNHDGIPEWICLEFHEPYGTTNSDFLCDDCEEKKAQSQCDDCGAWGTEPHDATCDTVKEYDGPPDGDAWSGGFARNH